MEFWEKREKREIVEIVEFWERRESCGFLWPTRDALCPQTHNTCLNNSFVGCGRHLWRPYMMAINIVLLLWRECVLSRLFVYFR